MRKIIAVSIVCAMVLVSVPIAMGHDWDDNDSHSITTTVNIVGGGGNGGGGGAPNGAPIIKCKWEYDAEVILPPAEPGQDPYCIYHDASPSCPGLDVKPQPGDDVTVEYYAVVTDPQGKDHIDHVYADIWHPNGQFKYQIELSVVGLTTGGYDKSLALEKWSHVIQWHYDLITHSDFTPQQQGWTQDQDIYYELVQEEAYLYAGEAPLSYCQPAGYYCVGMRAVDKLAMWSDYLYNQFWYIPTAAVQLDFTTVHYGDAVVSTWLQKGGDNLMDTPNLPTVKNIGNTPVYFTINQDDTGFGKTGIPPNDVWNVEYKARLSHDGAPTLPYWPGVTATIPGSLGMCTQEKLDFYIHVFKGFPGNTNTGYMNLCANIYGIESTWVSPLIYAHAPSGIAQTCTCSEGLEG